MEVRTLHVEELGGAADVPVGTLQDHLDVLLLALRLERAEGKDAGTLGQAQHADLLAGLLGHDGRGELLDRDRVVAKTDIYSATLRTRRVDRPVLGDVRVDAG